MSNNRNKIIVLVVLGLVAAFFVLRPFLTESEQDRIYRENMAKSAQNAAAGGAPASAATAPGEASGPGMKSQFQKAAVDIDELIASIKEISFNYDTDRVQTDPMTPLVGPAAHRALASTAGEDAAAGGFTASGDSQMILRTFRVTGILWDKRDPMAVVTYPEKGQLTSEVVTRGFAFPDSSITVLDIEQERVILDAGGTQVSLQLEER